MLSRELVADLYCQWGTVTVNDVDALARAVALVLVRITSNLRHEEIAIWVL